MYKIPEYSINYNGCTITTNIPSNKKKTFCEMESDGKLVHFDINQMIQMANEFSIKKSPDNAIAFTISQILAILEKNCKDNDIDIGRFIMGLKW